MTSRAQFLCDLVGKPYKPNAKGPNEYDCWSLVKSVRWALFEDTLPDFDVPSDPSLLWLARTFEHNEERKRWVQVDKLKDGSLVLMSRASRAVHVGIWLSLERGVLHAIEGDGVVFQDLLVLKASGWGNLRYFERVANACTAA